MEMYSSKLHHLALSHFSSEPNDTFLVLSSSSLRRHNNLFHLSWSRYFSISTCPYFNAILFLKFVISRLLTFAIFFLTYVFNYFQIPNRPKYEFLFFVTKLNLLGNKDIFRFYRHRFHCPYNYSIVVNYYL